MIRNRIRINTKLIDAEASFPLDFEKLIYLTVISRFAGITFV